MAAGATREGEGAFQPSVRLFAGSCPARPGSAAPRRPVDRGDPGLAVLRPVSEPDRHAFMALGITVAVSQVDEQLGEFSNSLLLLRRQSQPSARP